MSGGQDQTFFELSTDLLNEFATGMHDVEDGHALPKENLEVIEQHIEYTIPTLEKGNKPPKPYSRVAIVIP